jgi:hypothetical protein
MHQVDLFAPEFPHPDDVPNWRQVMDNAGSADEARQVISAFEGWLHDLLAAAGAHEPLCGKLTTGGYRGFSVINAEQWRKQLADLPDYTRETVAAGIEACKEADTRFDERFYPTMTPAHEITVEEEEAEDFDTLAMEDYEQAIAV